MGEKEKEADRVIDYLASIPSSARTTVDRSVAREMLLSTDGWLTVNGYIWDIRVKDRGAGVCEVRLEIRS